MTDLKPCPFCGGKANLREYQIDFRVMCSECGCRAKLCSTEKEAVEAWNRREETVKDQPAADVMEVRHGRWIEDHEFFKCSECGYLTDYRLSNFCPDCGAKMDGKVSADK